MDYMNQCPMILREYFGYMETIKGKSVRTVVVLPIYETVTRTD